MKIKPAYLNVALHQLRIEYHRIGERVVTFCFGFRFVHVGKYASCYDVEDLFFIERRGSLYEARGLFDYLEVCFNLIKLNKGKLYYQDFEVRRHSSRVKSVSLKTLLLYHAEYMDYCHKMSLEEFILEH